MQRTFQRVSNATAFPSRVLYLNGPSEVGLGKAQPQHASNGHANTEPGEEAEEVDDREDVLRDGVHHGQQTLTRGEWRQHWISLTYSI